MSIPLVGGPSSAASPATRTQVSSPQPALETWDDPTGDPRAGRLPDFVIVGAMKSGTTTLFEYLGRHPQLFMCTPKEPGFFSRRHVYNRGWSWYHSQFAEARPEQLAGEASTCYSRWPHFGDVPGRMAKFIPDAKLVFQMRHPVDRAYSHYGHMMQERVVVGSRDPEHAEPIIDFEEALETIPEIIDASRYLVQIEQFLPHYPRDRWHFMTLDAYKRNPGSELNRLQAFLGVAVRDLIAEGGPVAANQAGDALQKAKWMQRVERVRRLLLVDTAVRLVPKETRPRLRQWANNLKVGRRLEQKEAAALKSRITPLTPETRRRLLEVFEPATRELERFVGQELPAWHR